MRFTYTVGDALRPVYINTKCMGVVGCAGLLVLSLLGLFFNHFSGRPRPDDVAPGRPVGRGRVTWWLLSLFFIFPFYL